MSNVPMKFAGATRALAARDARRHNVIVGAVLAVVAVLACILVAFLLLWLRRQSRRERRLKNRIDLLESGNLRISDVPIPPDESVLNGEIPHPALPTALSVTNSIHSNVERKSLTSSHISTFHSDAEIIKYPRPAPSISRWSVSPTDTTFTSQRTWQSFTKRTFTNAIKPPISAFSSLTGNSSADVESSDAPVTLSPRSRFTVMNLSDADSAHLGEMQISLPTNKELPPSYPSDHTRGRDPPFPCKNRRPLPIVVTVNRQDGPEDSDTRISILSPDLAKAKRHSYIDVPASPYMRMIPVIPPSPGVSTPGAGSTRSSFTITASHPVSSVVIGDVSHVRRADGSKGKGRMVTMSVVVEDSGSSDGDPDERRATLRPISEGNESRGEAGSRRGSTYADLPPYEFPGLRRSGLVAGDPIEEFFGNVKDIKA